MTGIAEELDARLKRLDPETAASVERLVRDALALAEKDRAAEFPEVLPPSFWTKIREDWGAEAFERPAQGISEIREDW